MKEGGNKKRRGNSESRGRENVEKALKNETHATI
jgi:hypothetical protein